MLCAALDLPDLSAALAFAERVAPFAGTLKVGLELFVAHGPEAVRQVQALGCNVFLDLKLHDIPETVGRSSRRAADLGVDLLTVHASGGPAMVQAAVRGAEGSSLKVIAVTVLTSLDSLDLARLGVGEELGAHSQRLADLALAAGAAGLVSSPHEVGALRAAHPSATLVTPGIRLESDEAGDQKRVASPRAAVAAGSSLLVVGRPLRDAPDLAAAAGRLLHDIDRGREQAGA